MKKVYIVCVYFSLQEWMLQTWTTGCHICSWLHWYVHINNSLHLAQKYARIICLRTLHCICSRKRTVFRDLAQGKLCASRCCILLSARSRFYCLVSLLTGWGSRRGRKKFGEHSELTSAKLENSASLLGTRSQANVMSICLKKCRFFRNLIYLFCSEPVSYLEKWLGVNNVVKVTLWPCFGAVQWCENRQTKINWITPANHEEHWQSSEPITK